MEEKKKKKKAPRLKPLNIQFKCWFRSPEHTLEAALLGFQPAPWLSPLVLVQSSPTPCRANLCSVNRAAVTGKLGCRPGLLGLSLLHLNEILTGHCYPNNRVEKWDKKINKLHCHGADRIILKMPLTPPVYKQNRETPASLGARWCLL